MAFARVALAAVAVMAVFALAQARVGVDISSPVSVYVILLHSHSLHFPSSIARLIAVVKNRDDDKEGL
jgi:hypothetical protein